MKTLITYGATIAVTVATFTALAQSTDLTKSHEYESSDDSHRITKELGNTELTLQQAVDTVVAQRGGQVFEVERENEDGRRVYEIKGVDAKGKRYEVYLDVVNGQTIKSEHD